MEKITVTTLALLLGAQSLVAQYKRYPTLEHFTNSWCSSCAARNPALYNYLAPYAGQYHHMTIHPNVPYQGCVFYQANTTENTARKNYYGVSGTPQVFMNGSFAGMGSSLVSASAFTSALQEKSALGIQVSETTGNNRTATIRVHSAAQPQAGDYVLHVAVLEKSINLTTPNGESIHHNVFRKFLTPVDGLAFTPAANGSFREYTYNYSIAANWNAAEIYVIAFVQDKTTKRIENSGTKFDSFVLSALDVNPALAVNLSPNPAKNFVQVTTEVPMQTLEVFNMHGARVYQINLDKQKSHQVQLEGFQSGIYLARISTSHGNKTMRFIVE